MEETEEERQRREAAEASAAQVQVPLYKKTTESSGSTTRKVYGADEAPARAELQGATADSLAAVEQARQVAEMQARAKEADADARAKVLAEHEAERARVAKEQDDAIARASIERDEKIAKHAATSLHDPWQDKTAQQKTRAGIMIALGGFFQGLSQAGGIEGARNQALDSINAGIEQDYQRQKDRIDKMKDEVSLASGRVVDGRARKAELLKELDIQKIGRLEGAAVELEKRGAQIGTEEAKVAALEHAAKIREKAAKDRLALSERDAVEKRSQYHSTTIAADSNYLKGGAAKSDPLAIYGADGVVIGHGPTPTVTAKTNANIQNARQAKEILGMLRESQKKGPAMSWGEYGSRAEAMGKLTVLMKNDQELGALIGSDIALLSSQTGGKLEQMLGTAGPKLDAAIKDVDRGMVARLDSMGIKGSEAAPKVWGNGIGGAPPAQAAARSSFKVGEVKELTRKSDGKKVKVRRNASGGWDPA